MKKPFYNSIDEDLIEAFRAKCKAEKRTIVGTVDRLMRCYVSGYVEFNNIKEKK